MATNVLFSVFYASLNPLIYKIQFFITVLSTRPGFGCQLAVQENFNSRSWQNQTIHKQCWCQQHVIYSWDFFQPRVQHLTYLERVATSSNTETYTSCVRLPLTSLGVRDILRKPHLVSSATVALGFMKISTWPLREWMWRVRWVKQTCVWFVNRKYAQNQRENKVCISTRQRCRLIFSLYPVYPRGASFAT